MSSAGPGSRLRTVLLACGAASSALYLATDVLGGLRYPGYSFSAQMVSELMAVGAPSESFVDPLFLAYNVLVLAFGVGLLREGRRGWKLRVVGALLIAYAALGFTGPTLFEMHPRGTASVAEDLPHLVLTGVLVLLTFGAMAFGALALGRAFRVYSFATIAAMLVLGFLGSRYGDRLSAGEPTPGFGTIERLDIYASMLWIAVLGVGVLRAGGMGGTGRAGDTRRSELRAGTTSISDCS